MLKLIERSQRQLGWFGWCGACLVASTICYFGDPMDRPNGPITFWLAPVYEWAGPKGLSAFFLASAVFSAVRYFVGPKGERPVNR